MVSRDIFTVVEQVHRSYQQSHLSSRGEENGVNKTYRWVHVQDLFVPLAPEEKAVGVVVNHLKVGARVRRGRLSLPVVEAAAEKGGTSNL